MGLQKISFSVAGEKQYSRAFEVMAHEVTDMSEPLNAIGRSIISHVHQQFASEGGAGSYGKWKPLNPDYEAWKRQQVGDQPILVFTGQSRAAMIDPGAVQVSPRRMVYAPDVESFMGDHQEGTNGMPRRRIVDLPTNLRRRFDRIFVEWLQAQRSIL